jgi:hypothetical protein
MIQIMIQAVRLHAGSIDVAHAFDVWQCNGMTDE